MVVVHAGDVDVAIVVDVIAVHDGDVIVAAHHLLARTSLDNSLLDAPDWGKQH